MLRELTVCIFIPSFKGKGVQADQLVMRKRIANSHKKTISHWSEESLLDCPCSFIEKKNKNGPLSCYHPYAGASIRDCTLI